MYHGPAACAKGNREPHSLTRLGTLALRRQYAAILNQGAPYSPRPSNRTASAPELQ